MDTNRKTQIILFGYFIFYSISETNLVPTPSRSSPRSVTSSPASSGPSGLQRLTGKAQLLASPRRARQLPKTPDSSRLSQQIRDLKRNVPDVDNMMASTPFLESTCTLPVSLKMSDCNKRKLRIGRSGASCTLWDLT